MGSIAALGGLYINLVVIPSANCDHKYHEALV